MSILFVKCCNCTDGIVIWKIDYLWNIDIVSIGNVGIKYRMYVFRYFELKKMNIEYWDDDDHL